MNIKQAKDEVKNTVKAYLLKDKFGSYRIDLVRQRPLLIIGAPGIGKTDIMEQVAIEMGIGLVSYSMTHHTRQSAIGLPYIAKKEYEGKEYSVSEYTMSEIIASIHEYIGETGLQEGILFLDEINCISETLSPAMLQFLQYKTFGNHPIPKGWVVVTAGNPPEYNKSVREFDVVTLDRVKKIEVEADLGVWKEYALKKGIHSAVTTFLEIKRNCFYSVESTVDGKAFVTARGWEDLSQMIQLYEELELEINEKLCVQYIQNKAIAKNFAIYYALYNKYKSDYKVIDILNGNYTEEVKERAKGAKFDERITLLGLLMDASIGFMKDVLYKDDYVSMTYEVLKGIKTVVGTKGDKRDIIEVLEDIITFRKADIEKKVSKGLVGKTKAAALMEVCVILDEYLLEFKQKELRDKEKGFGYIKKEFEKLTLSLENDSEETKSKLNNMFMFIDEVFGKEQEMLLVITELTSNENSAQFIGKYGSDKYFENNKDMLFYERQKDIRKEISMLDGMMK